jgi:hypothetical protein
VIKVLLIHRGGNARRDGDGEQQRTADFTLIGGSLAARFASVDARLALRQTWASAGAVSITLRLRSRRRRKKSLNIGPKPSPKSRKSTLKTAQDRPPKGGVLSHFRRRTGQTPR